MTIFISPFLLLAEEALEEPAGGGMMTMLVLFGPPLLLLFVMQTIFGRTDAKDRSRREKLVSSLRKNDPVVTIGGILGTVVSVSEDKETVTIKVDDGTRLKMQAVAIREVLSQPDIEKSEAN